MASLVTAQCLRKLVVSVIEDVVSSARSLAPASGTQIILQPSDGTTLSPQSLLWASFGGDSVPEDCKKLDSKQQKIRSGPVCKAPDLRKKPVPPYQYGYCKEPEPELPKSCPPRAARKQKGPCCLSEGQSNKKGGCRGR